MDIDGDGQQALDRLLANRSRYDAVLLDVMLPARRLFGRQATAQRRPLRAGVDVTARGRPEDVLNGFESGADDYLPNPFELTILLARLRGLLRRANGWSTEHEHEQITFAGRSSISSAGSARRR